VSVHKEIFVMVNPSEALVSAEMFKEIGKGLPDYPYVPYREYNGDRRHPAAGGLTRATQAMVLAGGRGERLGPLTDWRCKPATPFGGKFRIIDFTLSNCVNSGIRRVGILTQYKAQSLIRHVQRGWSTLDGRLGEFVELLPAQQRTNSGWYRGTADAIYQNLDLLRMLDPQYVLVLAGDHVYKMDYGRMLVEHAENRANLTIAAIDVPTESASRFGIVGIDPARRVTSFVEKPAHPPAIHGQPGRSLASMGIYVFNAAFLYEHLIRDADCPHSSHDFGKDVVPEIVRQGCGVFAHDFRDSCVNVVAGRPYWRDVGTIDAFWEANLDLVRVTPDLNLYDPDWPVWTYQEQLPPAKVVFDNDERRGMLLDSSVAGGCIVSGATVRRSLLSSSVRVNSWSLVEDSVVLPNVNIGRHAVVRRAVIDRYCQLPEGIRIGVDLEDDRRRYHVTPNRVVLVTPDMLGQTIHHVR
jgi:glucose-1-phosphate adenylyltransferase